jgi:hypothetical protein
MLLEVLGNRILETPRTGGMGYMIIFFVDFQAASMR